MFCRFLCLYHLKYILNCHLYWNVSLKQISTYIWHIYSIYILQTPVQCVFFFRVLSIGCNILHCHLYWNVSYKKQCSRFLYHMFNEHWSYSILYSIYVAVPRVENFRLYTCAKYCLKYFALPPVLKCFVEKAMQQISICSYSMCILYIYV